MELAVAGTTLSEVRHRFRWIAVAAAVVAVAGSGLGVLATLQYEPPCGFFVVGVFLVPA